MKTRSAKSFCFLGMLALGFLAVLPRAYPQTPAGLSIKLYAGYAGLSITGAVGNLCSIKYVSNLTQTNNWLPLTNFVIPSSPYLWMETVPATGSRFYRVVTEVVTPVTNMVWIPPGSFTMGSPTNELARQSQSYETQHAVTLTKGFYMGKFEVTQGEYLGLMVSNPSYFNGDRSGDPWYDQDYGTNLDRPVEFVSWFDATNYCDQLTQQKQAAGHIPTNWVYRLPTEAEWEYACRAGTATPFHYGQDLLSGMANFEGHAEYLGGIEAYHVNGSGTSLVQTTTVGGYQTNAFGLYDMHGNVSEWCQDWYDSYPTGSVTDPQGPPSPPNPNAPKRLLRGGSWASEGQNCRSAKRFFDSPGAGTYNDYGFRVVLAPGQ